jgi:hypothetical protein
MKNSRKISAGAIVVMLSFISLFSAPIIEPLPIAPILPLYPQPVLTPASPTQKDSVTLWLILGQSSSSCVPTYMPSYKVTQVSHNVCVRAPCPQDYVISITYTENPALPLGRPCLLVVTNYGPRFEFGKLAVGNYTVLDSTSKGTTVATFSVTEQIVSYKVSGTVTQDPGATDILMAIQSAKVYLKTGTGIPILLAKKSAAIAYPLYTIIDSATTDAGGKFTFESVSQGAYVLGLAAAGYQSRDVVIQVPPDTQVSVSLLKTGAVCTVTGSVKELQRYCPDQPPCPGLPIPGCSVTVYIPLLLQPITMAAIPIVLGNRYTAVTDNAGLYPIDSIPVTYDNTTVTVTASKTGFAPESKQAALFSNSSVTVSFALSPAYTNPETTTVSDVAFIVATEKSRYVKGESIKTRYTIKNNSIATVTFNFSSGCQFDMVAIAPPKDTAYWYGRLLACTMMATQMVLAPGQSRSTDFTAFSYNDTASAIAVTAKMIGYDRSASTVIVPIAKVTAALPVQKKLTDAKKPVITYSASTKTLSLNIIKSQTVSVSAYVLSGQKISQLSTKKFLTAGMHSISLKNASLANGIIVFRVEGEGFSAVKRINLMDSR